MAEGIGVKLLNARMMAQGIVSALKPFCERIEIAGSIRRRRPTVNDIDIVVIVKPEFADALKNVCTGWHPGTADILAPPDAQDFILKWGKKMATFNYKKFVQVDLYFATAETFPIVFLIRTGSKEHNIWLCQSARNQGKYLAADGSGVYADRDKKQPYIIKTEGDIYGALGLHYFEPEDRDGEFVNPPSG